MALDFGPGRKRLSLSTASDIKKGILWRPKETSSRFVYLDGIPRTNNASADLVSLAQTPNPP